MRPRGDKTMTRRDAGHFSLRNLYEGGSAMISPLQGLPQEPYVLRLVSIPIGDGEERNYYLICGCGWCSWPYHNPPDTRVCEA